MSRSDADRPRWLRMRKRVSELLDVPESGDRASQFADLFIISLIVVNVTAMTLETVEALQLRWHFAFRALEQVSLYVFSIEYLLRVWSIVDNKWRNEYRDPLWGRLRFMRSPMAIIDLLAVLPFWLQMIFPLDLRVLRIVRLLRVLKLTRYSAATNLLFEVLREKSRVVGASLFILLLLLILAATITYMVEHDTHPESFSSIPQAMWWSIVTVTTVGYGDVVPITTAGKILGSLLGFIGVALIALPTGILASGFSDALERRRSSLRRDLKRALSDGVVDSRERQELEWEGQRLSLSQRQIEAILSEQVSMLDTPGTVLSCPHCGKALAAPADDGTHTQGPTQEPTQEP